MSPFESAAPPAYRNGLVDPMPLTVDVIFPQVSSLSLELDSRIVDPSVSRVGVGRPSGFHRDQDAVGVADELGAGPGQGLPGHPEQPVRVACRPGLGALIADNVVVRVARGCAGSGGQFAGVSSFVVFFSG